MTPLMASEADPRRGSVELLPLKLRPANVVPPLTVDMG